MERPFENVNYKEEAIFSSEIFWKYKKISEDNPPPFIMLLCFSDSLFNMMISKYKNKKINGLFGDLRVFKTFNYKIGILGKFGIGGPVTAVLTEDLKQWGVKIVISLGLGSSIQNTVRIGDFIIVEKALRDEGTSFHYESSQEYAFPSEELLKKISTNITFKNLQVHYGSVWTTDAIYRETKSEVLTYQSKNILAVEMETATLYTVGKYCNIQCISIIGVSDSIASLKWEFKNNSDEINKKFLDLLNYVLEYLQNEFI